MAVKEEDIKLQESRVKELRKKLQLALENLENMEINNGQQANTNSVAESAPSNGMVVVDVDDDGDSVVACDAVVKTDTVASVDMVAVN